LKRTIATGEVEEATASILALAPRSSDGSGRSPSSSVRELAWTDGCTASFEEAKAALPGELGEVEGVG
jgi:hypothetical protein